MNKSYFDNNKYTILTSYLTSFSTLVILSLLTVYFSNFFNITLDFVGVTLRLFQALGMLSGAINKIANSHIHLKKFHDINLYSPKITENAFKVNKDLDKNKAIIFDNVSAMFDDVSTVLDVVLATFENFETMFVYVSAMFDDLLAISDDCLAMFNNLLIMFDDV